MDPKKVGYTINGIITLALGATIVAYCNQLLPSDATKTTVDGVNVSKLTVVRNIGWFFTAIGILTCFVLIFAWALPVKF